MTLERRLQIELAVTTALGSLLLAIAEQEPRLAVLALAASATSVYFADVKGWIVLNSLWSNVAGVAALGLTLWHWHSLESELLFIALANFLTYLQCILHYRAKALHVYGMLLLLSFLQMAIAAVLAATFLFGCMLVAYLWSLLRTCALFCIYREEVEAAHGPARRLPDTLTLAEFFVTPLHQLVLRLGRRRSGPAAAPTPPMPVARWPLAGRVNQLTPRPTASQPRQSVRGLVWQMSRLGLLALPVAAIVFTAIPRSPGQRFDDPRRTAMTGFSERVSLQDIARLRENPDEIMRVRVYDQRTGQPYELLEPPWLRGSALGRYARGAWNSEEWSTARPVSLDDLPGGDALPDPGENDLVRFEVTLEPMPNSSVVFTLEPAHRVPGAGPSNLRKDVAIHAHYRPFNRRRSTFDYQLLSTGLKDGRQPPFRPQDEPFAWEQKSELLEPFAALHLAPDRLREKSLRGRRLEHIREAVRRQRESLQGLADQAAGVLTRAGLDARSQPREAALALERFLQFEGGFSYSLTPPVREQRREEVDPVNQFVVEEKRGHCEYFASALVLMLRSQGIPARMVVGYKGGTWNAVAGYYEVRQQEAHAWAEAWIFDNEQPLGWLRLDGTPGDEAPVIPSEASLTQWKNYATYLWARYVLGMDANVQEDLVQPLAGLFSRERWRSVAQWLWTTALGQEGTSLVLSWRIVALAITGPILLLMLTRWLRRAWRRLRAWRVGRPRRRGSVPHVDFYVRLERLLARCGLARRESQTAWEFAADSAGALAASSATLAAAALLPPIVEAYYRVRFGGPPLSDEETQRLSDELARLEEIVFQSQRQARGQGHPPHPPR